MSKLKKKFIGAILIKNQDREKIDVNTNLINGIWHVEVKLITKKNK